MENKTKITDKDFSWLLGVEDETEYESTPQEGTEIPEIERPTNKQEIENVARACCLIRIAEFEPVALKSHHLHTLVVEVGKELLAGARERTPIQMCPYRLHQGLHAYVGEVVVYHHLQVFVHRKHRYGVQFGQYARYNVLATLPFKGVLVERFHILLPIFV